MASLSTAPNWQVRHLEHDGTPITEFFAPENLSFTLNKGENGAHDVSYEISRSRDLVFPAFVRPYEMDFELARGDLTVIAGIVTFVGVQTNEESVKVAGKSYLHYLDRRMWPFDDSDPNLFRYAKGLTFANYTGPPFGGQAYGELEIEASDVVRDLLDIILLDPHCLNFTHDIIGVGNTIDHYEVQLIDTESIYSKIQSLSQEDPGEFDFWMTNDKVFKMAAPRQYPISVASNEDLAEHTFDDSIPESGFHEVTFGNTGPIATWIVGQGSGGSFSIANTREYLPGSEQFRRLDTSADFPGVLNTRGRISKLTRRKLLFGLNPVHEVTLTVVPERVNNFWTRFSPGKAIWVKAKLEGWTIDSAQEIVSMDCTIDLSGNETISMKLNQIYDSEGIVVD